MPPRSQIVRRAVDAYEAALPAGGWPNWVLGNHDVPRVATRFGPAAARTANMLLLTLRGTPTTYYGEEIGMTDLIITEPEKLRDTMAVWYHQQMVEELGVATDVVAADLENRGTWFRVAVAGGYPTLRRARSVLDTIKSFGYEGAWIERTPDSNSE